MGQIADQFTITVFRIDESGEENEVQFSRPISAGNDFELNDDEQGAVERVIDYFASGFTREIPETNHLAHWWCDFLRGPMRNIRIGTDEFRRSRAGLIPFYELLDVAEYAGIEVSQMGQYAVVELLDAIASKPTSATEQTIEQTIEIKLKTPKMEWKARRETLNETIEDQMLVLFKKDPRTAAMTSSEIAATLNCSEQSIRKPTNKVWQMFKAEKEENKRRLKRRHTSDSTADIDNE